MRNYERERAFEMRETENNKVALCGKIIKDFEFSHETYGNKVYKALFENERLSGHKDIIPIMVPDRLFGTRADWKGSFARVAGQFRSHNRAKDGERRCILSVLAREFEVIAGKRDFELEYENQIFLDGYICKPPIYRKTPLGREIADILLAVNRSYGKSDYIPCIAWGRNARFASGLEVGTRLRIDGRIQSREYQKQISDGEYETRTAYEVSASKLTLVEET